MAPCICILDVVKLRFSLLSGNHYIIKLSICESQATTPPLSSLVQTRDSHIAASSDAISDAITVMVQCM